MPLFIKALLICGFNGEEHTRWWPKADTKAFRAAYQQLLDEGRKIVKTATHQSLIRHQQLTTLLESERRQVSRLRALTGSFDLRRHLRTLSLTDGLLNQAATRLTHHHHAEASVLLKEAEQFLHPVESYAMAQMQRYGAAGHLAKWNDWVADTVKWSSTTGGTAIVAVKALRQLVLYQHGKLFRRFSVELGFSGLQDKIQEGDGATPEGKFRIIRKKWPGTTKYNKALLLNYPTTEQRRRFQEAKVRGVLSAHPSIGGLIEIHGKQNRGKNTTNGCIALDNTDMDVVFQLAREGTPVTIVGAIHSENWIVRALEDIATHARSRSARTSDSRLIPQP